MGLLTDPGAGRGRLTQLLVIYHNKLCTLLYIGGLVWFVVLAHEHFNTGTYFSENALLPGLVRGDFDEDAIAKQYQSELIDEAARYPEGVPYSWLLAKFRQLSLDTYTHNFTLNYPLGYGMKFTGKNVYAILRAPRSSSTEALVLSVPYRPPNSVHPSTAPSIALMLSLAKFFRRQKYWAKDIIFLVTEHEQLGAQAWLEAYHHAECGRGGVLQHGDMAGRGGAIQAAINLELHADKLSHIDVKVEGLNGQLPNLDLVNLAHRMCSKEGVRHTFKNREKMSHRDTYREWLHQLRTLVAMVTTQATGVPTGNHGLFHRFGIEAITLEGFQKLGKGSPAVFYQMGRVLEGLFRSLNNLLERFHQSYFFYLLPATDRYISIGMYMPPLGLLCAALLLKAFALWLKMHQDASEELDQEDKMEYVQTMPSLSLVPVGVTVLATHAAGVLLLSAAQPISVWGQELVGLGTDSALAWGYALAGVFLATAGTVVAGSSSDEVLSLLHIAALLEMATLLLAVAMHNFSLALLSAVLYVPAALCTSATPSSTCRFLQRVLWAVLHPLSVLMLVVTVFTAGTFPGEPFAELVDRALGASKQALVYAIVDGFIYGNWVFSVATAVLLPNWLLFWIVATSNPLKNNK